MSISELGSLGEFFGSIILIVSVIYLAVQVRQASKAERNTAMQAIISASAHSTERIADDPTFAEITLKLYEPDSLNEIERRRLNAHCMALYHHLDGAFHMYKAGLLDEEVWAKFAYEAPLWIQLPAVQQWFNEDRSRLSASFLHFLDQRVEETDLPDVVPTVPRIRKQEQVQPSEENDK